MSQVGAYEAKTHFAQFLDRVARGETFTITKHGQPVAVLGPVRPAPDVSVEDAITRLRAGRKNRTLGVTTLRELIDEGRRR